MKRTWLLSGILTALLLLPLQAGAITLNFGTLPETFPFSAVSGYPPVTLSDLTIEAQAPDYTGITYFSTLGQNVLTGPTIDPVSTGNNQVQFVFNTDSGVLQSHFALAPTAGAPNYVDDALELMLYDRDGNPVYDSLIGATMDPTTGLLQGYADVSGITFAQAVFLFDYSGVDATDFYITDLGYTVPEPSTFLLLAAGASGLALLRVRRKQA